MPVALHLYEDGEDLLVAMVFPRFTLVTMPLVLLVLS